MKSNSTDYLKFIHDFFPKSYIVKDEARELIYSRVCENNVITSIYNNHISRKNFVGNIIFLEGYKLHFNKLLLYIALNDPSGINFCVRHLTENLLKYIYSIYTNKEFRLIKMTSFRNMKDDLNILLKADSQTIKDEIQLLFSYYGKYSNSIHGKGEDEISEIEYMENIIKNKQYDLNKLDKDLIGILNSYQIIMSEILEIDQMELSTAELMQLKKAVSRKRFSKIITNLKKCSESFCS